MSRRSGMAKTFGRFAVAGVLCGWWGLGNLALGQSLDSVTWKSVSDCTSVPEVEFYLKSFPDGRHVRDARECLVRLARSEPRFRFKDTCGECPELVLIPPGTYTMGSERRESGGSKYEEPRHKVTIVAPFAVGMHEVTRGDFGLFVKETGHRVKDSCWTMSKDNGEWKSREGFSWHEPGYSQTDRHPVVCVGWGDAKAYAHWLSDRTGAEYRLLSESEWEYAARAGTDTSRYWGWSASTQCEHENALDGTFTSRFDTFRWHDYAISCSDGHIHTAPATSFGKPNPFGLFDMLGNAREWVEDCWQDQYKNVPTDGRARTHRAKCKIRTVRGGSWANVPQRLRSAMRAAWRPESRSDVVGFRVARTVRWGGK